MLLGLCYPCSCLNLLECPVKCGYQHVSPLCCCSDRKWASTLLNGFHYPEHVCDVTLSYSVLACVCYCSVSSCRFVDGTKSTFSLCMLVGLAEHCPLWTALFAQSWKWSLKNRTPNCEMFHSSFYELSVNLSWMCASSLWKLCLLCFAVHQRGQHVFIVWVFSLLCLTESVL